MRTTTFPTLIKVRADADLRDGLLKAAEEQRTTVSGVVRRELRSALAGRSSTSSDDDPGPFRPAPGQRIAA